MHPHKRGTLAQMAPNKEKPEDRQREKQRQRQQQQPRPSTSECKSERRSDEQSK